MMEIPFNERDIEATFDDGDYSRGRGYYRKGAVQNLKIEEDGYLLTAQVRGTRPRPYKVIVSIAPGRGLKSGGFTRPFIGTECSCPVSVGCKHAAAVCLEALAAQARTQMHAQRMGTIPLTSDSVTSRKIGKVIASLPPHMRATIKTPETAARAADPWDKWLEGIAQTAADAPLVRAKESVLYILEMVEDAWQPSTRYFRIRPVVSRILKDGSYAAPRDASPSHLSRSQAHYVTPADRTIAKLMESSSSSLNEFRASSGDPDLFDVILRRVIATGRGFFQTHHNRPLTVGGEKPAKLGWRIELDGSQSPTVLAESHGAPLVVLTGARPWYVDTVSQIAGQLAFDAPLALVHKFLAGPKLRPNAIKAVAEKMAAKSLPGGIEPPRPVQFETRKAAPPVPCLRLTAHTQNSAYDMDANEADHIHHLALLHFDYDGIAVDPKNAPDVMRQQIDNRIIAVPRDRKAETAAIQRLTENSGLGPTYIHPPDVPSSRHSYAFSEETDTRLQWLDFLHHNVPELRTAGWRITVDDHFAERFTAIEVDEGDSGWDADLKEKEGSAWWFSLDLGIMVEGQRVALLPLLVQALKRLPEPTTTAIDSLARSGKLYVDLPDGRALALPFERVRDVLTTLVELYDQPLNPDGSMTVSLDLATALARIDAATRMRWLGGKRLKNLIDQLKTFDGLVEVLPPQGLNATLRPYQREGLNWLQFLRSYGLGGILADDMGLGKTIQTLAHILIEKEARRLDRPCLIVCPTSLIPNWLDEAAKFAPRLKVLALHGKERAARFDAIDKADLVLTTYPLLPRDAEILLPIAWHMVVLDEAQAIKNPTAQVTQLACELKTKNRLCLTGTPIENHLGEAWSHFAFLMPGMLGSHKDFTKRFRIPIEKHKDGERQALLARRLKPFILRRNKSEVAKELPPKTEIIHHIEFGSAQRDLYETVRLTMHEKVQQAVESKGFNRSRIVILDALLKLRQVACDPRLVKLDSARKVKHSAKLESLMDMLPEMIEEGRRILLFSQFTSMLDLVKLELDKSNIPFVEIRGDTTDRKTPVTQFQNGDVPLFLISLKAGGTGLNLTAADTVIHYDPWWNPAVENQATDRAHRIGQNKPVFVYKFIAKGTVEERILDLQNRKRGLAAALMDERPDATAAFEAGDLDFLFKEVG